MTHPNVHCIVKMPGNSNANPHYSFGFGPASPQPKPSSPKKKDTGPKLSDPTLSKKMRESLALNQPAESDEDSSSSSEGGEGDYDSDSSEDGGGRPAPKKARRHSLPPPPQSMTGTVSTTMEHSSTLNYRKQKRGFFAAEQLIAVCNFL